MTNEDKHFWTEAKFNFDVLVRMCKSIERAIERMDRDDYKLATDELICGIHQYIKPQNNTADPKEIKLSGMTPEEVQLVAETTGYIVVKKNKEGECILRLRDGGVVGARGIFLGKGTT